MSTPAGQVTEDERAYLQDRMAVFGKALFIVSLLLLSLDLNCYFASRPSTVVYSCINALICLAHWQIPLRGQYSAPTLHRFSLAVLLSSMLVLSVKNRVYIPMTVPDLTGSTLEQASTPVLGLVQIFGMMGLVITSIVVVMLRAAVVPSSRARTVRVTLLLGVPLVLISAFGAGPLEPSLVFRAKLGTLETVHTLAGATIFWAVTTFVCSIITGIVYGLRREVREARRLGPYTLERKLGEGGMGVVYQANHALLRRSTAVKLLSPERTGATNLRRFEQEVRLTARLTHPNTVTVFDYGHTPDGLFYYAMELLDGADLERVVKAGGPMPAGRALKVLAEVAGALEEAHGIGLIHRDIKPSNVILCARGGKPDVAKLVDFGLVKELSGGDEAGLTKPDVILGTPLYLAPEGLTSPDQVNERSDLYALGALGYYLLTGQHVFEGRTLVEVLGHHMHTQPVGLSEKLGRPVAKDIESLILQCLAKSPADRPASARELLDRLVACKDYGSWSEQAAHQWWATHASELSPAAGTATPVEPSEKSRPRTLTMALSEPARGAA